jgi:hypothetical protein
MKRMVLVGMLIAPLMVSPAYAVNYCFNLDFTGTIVVPRFRVPSKGTCKVYGGYLPVSVDVVTITACTNTAGTALRVGYSLHPGSLGSGDDGDYFFDGQMNIPLPLGSSFGVVSARGVSASAQSLVLYDTVTVAPCPLGQQLP